MLNNYICVLKECANEGGGKTDIHEVAKKEHIKWWLQIYGHLPMNSKEQLQDEKSNRLMVHLGNSLVLINLEQVSK